MSIIYCGKSNNIGYYIKEADISIYSIQELAYFIYNFPMLISKSFINKNLILYLYNDLDMKDLSNEINEIYNVKDYNIEDVLKIILMNSNMYSQADITKFESRLIKLLQLDEDSFIKLAGDSLYRLEKYDKAILQYARIANKNNVALKNMSFCYAKLQAYDKAIYYLRILYDRNKDMDVLKNIYFCYKLSGNSEKFNDIGIEVDEEDVTNWELEIMKVILKVRNEEKVKNIEEIFLMGEKYIYENLKMIIDIWKEEYRYIS